MFRHKLPLGLVVVAVVALVGDGVAWWLRLAVAGLLTGAAAAVFMRRVGLTWRGLVGGLRRDR
jgi:hypothetical protein